MAGDINRQVVTPIWKDVKFHWNGFNCLMYSYLDLNCFLGMPNSHSQRPPVQQHNYCMLATHYNSSLLHLLTLLLRQIVLLSVRSSKCPHPLKIQLYTPPNSPSRRRLFDTRYKFTIAPTRSIAERSILRIATACGTLVSEKRAREPSILPS